MMFRTIQRRGALQQPRGTGRGQATPFALSALAAAALTLLPVTDSAWAATEAEIATDRRKSNPKDLVALPAVTVTADKTEKPIENVPASVKVLSGEELEQSGISSFEQLEGRIPGLAFQPFGQSGINSPVMRGLTANINTLSTSTLLLVDGVPTLTAQGFENRFIDVDRIEVLRGPQSTLYGRNAEAGVIAVYSRPMDNQPRTSLSAELGSRNKRATRFSLSRPLVENQLYASVSGEWWRQDGFIDNVNTGGKADDRERYNINLGLRFRPHNTTDFVLRYTRQAYDDGAALWGAPSAPRKQVASGTPSWNHSFGQTFSLNASHEISPDLTICSITALNDFKDRVQQDTDFRPAEIAYIRRDHHLRTPSQEFRLEGRFRESDWLFGVYGDRSDNDLHSVGKRAMGREDLLIGQKSDTLALFTHWNLSLAPSWTLAVGSRVERYTTRIDPKGASNQRSEWTHFSPKVALQYKLAAGNQVHASVSKGVRNGGFNVLAPAANYIAFEPEKVWSYELGAKGWLADKTLRYSVAAYYMDVKDMQVMQMPRPGFMYITSAASATSKGVELEADYLLARGWMLRAGLAWNQTRLTAFRTGGPTTVAIAILSRPI